MVPLRIEPLRAVIVMTATGICMTIVMAVVIATATAVVAVVAFVLALSKLPLIPAVPPDLLFMSGARTRWPFTVQLAATSSFSCLAHPHTTFRVWLTHTHIQCHQGRCPCTLIPAVCPGGLSTSSEY